MTIRATFPWVLAMLPLACVVYMFAELSEAVLRLGHLPRYRVDPDPFHTSWHSVFPDHAAWIYFPLPLLLLLLLPLLAIPKLRYQGDRKVLFYTVLTFSVAATWLFVVHDITGYVRWSLD